MHRILVTTELLSQESPILPKDAAHHLRVLRMEDGEELELFDGHGSRRPYAVQVMDSTLTLRSVGDVVKCARPTANITLFACVTKGSRWDWTIEKATELGVTRIVPVISDRTIVRIAKAERAAKRERWLRIAEDAARQCDSLWLPEIMEPVDFKAALELVRATDCFVGALTEPPSPPLSRALAEHPMTVGRPRATFIGPEGDFTTEELAALCAIAIPTSFGPMILRAETAAIYALSIITACG